MSLIGQLKLVQEIILCDCLHMSYIYSTCLKCFNIYIYITTGTDDWLFWPFLTKLYMSMYDDIIICICYINAKQSNNLWQKWW